MTNRKEAISYLLQLETEEPKWAQLPDDDTRMTKLRLLFGAENKGSGPSRKRRKRTKVRVIENGKFKIYKNIEEVCNSLDLKVKSVYSCLDSDKEHKGLLLYRVYEDE